VCKVKARVRRKNVVLQTIGARGSREAKTHLGDLRQMRAFIVYKNDVGKLGLRLGSTVTVTVAGKRIKCKVKKWSRGSRLLLPLKDYPLKDVPVSKLKRVMVG